MSQIQKPENIKMSQIQKPENIKMSQITGFGAAFRIRREGLRIANPLSLLVGTSKIPWMRWR
jgi:hypothetical protein